MQPLDHVAAAVVLEVRACVVLHQVVQDRWDAVDRPSLPGCGAIELPELEMRRAKAADNIQQLKDTILIGFTGH